MKLCYMSAAPEMRGPMPLAWLADRQAIDFIRPLIASR